MSYFTVEILVNSGRGVLSSPVVVNCRFVANIPEDMTDLDGDGNTSEPTPFDLNSFSRFIDDICTTDTGNGTAPIVDMYNTPQKLGA